MKNSRSGVVVGLVAFALLAGGCGGSNQLPTATVKGKVTFNGQPVIAGTITFSPVAAGNNQPGKSATGTIGPDGSYTLSTYAQNDGAVVGKHTVSFQPPDTATEPGEGHTDAAAEAAESATVPFAGLKPKTPDVEVKSGDNTVDIELGPGG